MGVHCAFLSCLFEAKIAPMKTMFKKTQEDGKEWGKKREREKKGKEEGRILCLVSNVH